MSCRGDAKRRQSPISVVSTIATCRCTPRKHCSRLTAGANAGVSASPAIELIAARQLVLEESQVLAEDHLVFHRQRRARGRQPAQPVVVRRAPVRALTIDEAAPREELQDIVPAPQPPP